MQYTFAIICDLQWVANAPPLQVCYICDMAQSFEMTFNSRESAFAAESRDAMAAAILGFCEAKDSSVQMENVSETEIRVFIDEKKSRKAQEKFDKASQQCAAGKMNSARFTLNEVISLWPFHSEAYRLLAQIQFTSGKIDDAINTNIDALRFDPKNVWALLLMGNIFQQAKNRPDVADTYFSRILEYHPDNVLALNNLGGVYCKRDQYEKGLELFAKAIKLDPHCINSYYGTVLALSKMGNNKDAFDFAMMGLQLGEDRVEDGDIRHNLEDLMASIAVKLVDNDGMLCEAVQIAKKIENKFGTVIKFQQDDNQKVLAHMEFADFHKRDYHVVKYRRSGTSAHLVLHELMHLEMMLEAKAANRLMLIGGTQKNFEQFLDQYTDVFTPLSREIGEYQSQEFAKQLFQGISLQLMNCPLDLFVETKIFEEYPQFHAIQLVSLLEIEKMNLKSIIDSKNVPYIPEEIKLASKTLNMVSSLWVKEHFFFSVFEGYAPTKAQREIACGQYDQFRLALKSFKPGDEYDLFKDFTEECLMENLFTNSMMDGKPIAKETVKTNAEKAQERFNETHNPENMDPMITAMMSEYMLAAMQAFAQMDKYDIQGVARECAMNAVNGNFPRFER